MNTQTKYGFWIWDQTGIGSRQFKSFSNDYEALRAFTAFVEKEDNPTSTYALTDGDQKILATVEQRYATI